ncbi:tyrosine-type recombinase/integrase [Methylobacterium planeticum]|uniref:Site-specific integrase n=1 Tax=Methylobacterium planeticum TaxID=2615211 RepID=A0A6N6MG87_9HYPH|nr:site-specific integrase [Methylobacterium planeticum]KAB1068862.1 site-specific integrase [Methylobacterium planeticum]
MSDEPYEIGRLKGECVVAWWEGGKRKRYRLGTSDASEARRIAPAVYAERTRPKGNTVKELWDAYLIDKAGRAVTKIMPYEWKALEARFGKMSGEAITIADCRAHTDERRAAGRKDNTIVTELGRLRMVLVWAEKHKLIAEAPHIERPAAVKPKERHLRAHEVARLAEACKAPHLSLFVHLAYGTAGRAAAILGLTWERCDFERGKILLEDPDITVPHKGRAVVPMTKTLRLRMLAAREGAMSDHVIEWAGRRVTSVKKGLATAAQAAGLRHVHPHMLRHSAAVRQAEAGVPMEEIASYLGHSNPKVTRDIYARFSPEALSRGAAALELDDFEPQEVKRWTA